MTWVYIVGVALLVIWLTSGALEGWMEVKRRPTEPMEWCHRHGAFRKKHVLQVDGLTTICPVCWQEAWKKAGK